MHLSFKNIICKKKNTKKWLELLILLNYVNLKKIPKK
jgi:hypothetical protein